MTEVYELNNEAQTLISEHRYAEAEHVLDGVAEILERRAAESGPPVHVFTLHDAVFYHIWRVQLAWERQVFDDDVLSHAMQAYELEDRLYEMAPIVPEYILSAGSWCAVSVLSRLSRFAEAVRIAEATLADESRFAARLASHRDSAERLLVAVQCAYLNAGEQVLPISEGRVLLARVAALDPDPQLSDLLHGHACVYARLGEVEAALDWVARALDAGVQRSTLKADEDLAGLREHPRFRELMTPAWWTFKTTPAGAAIVIDDVDTGERTPGRVPAQAGRHKIRLRLAGYRDAVFKVHGRDDSGFERAADLESLAECEARKRMAARVAEDGKCHPDAEACARTVAFLGGAGGWRRATIVCSRDTTYGLGGVSIKVRGDGEVKMRHIPWDERTPVSGRHRLDEADTAVLFHAFVTEAFTEMFVGNLPGEPDEPLLALKLVAMDGREHRLVTFASHEHPRFAALYERVVTTVRERLAPDEAKRLGLR